MIAVHQSKHPITARHAREKVAQHARKQETHRPRAQLQDACMVHSYMKATEVALEPAYII